MNQALKLVAIIYDVVKERISETSIQVDPLLHVLDARYSAPTPSYSDISNISNARGKNTQMTSLNLGFP